MILLYSSGLLYLSPIVMQRKVAIFDVDGTIFRSSLLIELVNILIEKNIFPEQARSEFEKEETAWINRHGPYEDYIKRVVDVFMKYIKGMGAETLEDAAKEVSGQHENRTYRYTRGLIKKLKSEGYYMLAISHSPKLVLDSFGRKHGFDKIYGTIYTLDESNKFTGAVSDSELIFDKSRILERAVSKENLTLEDSVGVGDTESDISFLSLVSKPICFNPNKALYDHAQKKGWLTIVERKDVVYKIPWVPADSLE